MIVSNDSILDIAKEVQRLTGELNRTNLLDTVYVNENVHSRILKMILEYCHHGKYPFYESFLKIPKVSSILPAELSTEKIRCYNERDRIDLLIEGTDYAIIIENKVYYAVDQDRQIERYILSCIEREFRPDRIYVLYLTSDGSKHVSCDSLTDTAKTILGLNTDNIGRFADISFKYDLLPWLKDSINDSEKMELSQINAALIQYADYVAEMYGESENQSQYESNMIELLERHGIKTVADFTDNIDAVSKLSSDLVDRRDRYCRYLAERYVSTPLKEYCQKRHIQLLTDDYSYRFISIRISIPALQKATFGFHTESDGRNIYGISNNNVNDGEELSEEILKRFADIQQYLRSRWWPEYRFPADDCQQFLRPGTVDFWEGATPKSFASYVIDTYEEVEKLLQP